MEPQPPLTATFVDTVELLAQMLTLITVVSEADTKSPFLFIDVEGTNLSRNGSVSLLQILVRSVMDESRSQIFIIDIQTLQDAAFSTTIPEGNISLKSILESSDVTKVIFDVRNDSDALFSHYGINLTGVVDLQLMEYVTRKPYTSNDFKNKQAFFYNRLRGLAGCIEDHAGLSEQETRNWMSIKHEGTAMFDLKQGGSYEVFKQRPLPEALMKYSAGDVRYMSVLHDLYATKMDDISWQRVLQESTKRVQLSQQVDYDAHSKDKGKGPWTCARQRNKQSQSFIPSKLQKAMLRSGWNLNDDRRDLDEKRRKTFQSVQDQQDIPRPGLYDSHFVETQSSDKVWSFLKSDIGATPGVLCFGTYHEDKRDRAEPTASLPSQAGSTIYRTMPLCFKTAQEGFLASTFNKTSQVLILPPVGDKQTKPTKEKNKNPGKRERAMRKENKPAGNCSTVLPNTSVAASSTGPAPTLAVEKSNKRNQSQTMTTMATGTPATKPPPSPSKTIKPENDQSHQSSKQNKATLKTPKITGSVKLAQSIRNHTSSIPTPTPLSSPANLLGDPSTGSDQTQSLAKNDDKKQKQKQQQTEKQKQKQKQISAKTSKLQTSPNGTKQAGPQKEKQESTTIKKQSKSEDAFWREKRLKRKKAVTAAAAEAKKVG